MRQVVQNLKSGKVELRDVPAPGCGRGEVLVATRASLISAGTERMMMDFAGKSLAGKAKERPDLVRKVVAKMRRDGVADTLKSVFSRLEEPMPLGYSAAGVVVKVGNDLASEFAVGDRVAVAGAGLANHAEFNAVPKNLVVKLPDAVPFAEGCYATLGAIALHGVRNAGVQLGDRVLVVGLGLVGQLVAQLAAAAGARVAGVDPNTERCMLAKQGGAAWATSPKALEEGWRTFTDGRGFDAILICAATDSDGPIEQAAEWARDRAKVILVGKVGTRFPYASYMKKELTVRVSRSYGPGRYDPAFEARGEAYPVGFVPWTERENLGEVVRLMAVGKLKVGLLTTHEFGLDQALKGYELIAAGKPCLGVVLGYKEEGTRNQEPGSQAKPVKMRGRVGVSMVGVGGFARSVVLPAMQGISGWVLRGVVSKGGLTAGHVAEKYGAAWAASDMQKVLSDDNTHGVMVMTRHNAHAAQVLAALKADKNVWVEKPLALSLKDIDAVQSAAEKSGRVLMVGFNRRFSPALLPLKARLAKVSGPKQVLVRVNAGRLDDGGWQHSNEGGGRLLGEVCHFTDVCMWLIGAGGEGRGTRLESVNAVQGAGQDDYVVTLRFADGSVGTVFYSSEGDSGFAKERVEVFGGGATGVMDNYMSTVWSEGGRKSTLYKKGMFGGQEKGHAPAIAAWLQGCALGGTGNAEQGSQGIPGVGELCDSSRVVLWAEESISAGKPVKV
ncbi:MAG: zinc-binding dehydrogenase [Proteobacteria bacterium]|nr:zinc-binding dehydrogenase [Pseudomonadota bacterium]